MGTIRSLITATDIDVLPATSTVEDRGDYVVVRTPSNPSFYWGNFLMAREAPQPGDRERWEAWFDAEFDPARESAHYALTWDLPGVGSSLDGIDAPADHRGVDVVREFVDAGYQVYECAGLVAQPNELRAHARASRDVQVVALDPAGDDDLWQMVVELQVAARDPGHEEASYRAFATQRLSDRRERFRAGDGAWFVARAHDGEVVASCGVVVTEGRGRFQAVDTAEPHRRRGIATRLVHDAARAAIDRFGAQQLVIVADADYHAVGLYESLGFVERERSWELTWWPGAPNAARHPMHGLRAQPT